MNYALVHYPEIDTTHIDRLRRKYDPQFDLIAPHITIVFPQPESIGEQNLTAHIETVLVHWVRFPIHLRGLEKSWDDYLFLTLEEGSGEIIRLHKEICTGMLASRAVSRFVPHVTLGVFTGNLQAYSEAFEEAACLDFDYRCVVDRVHLVKVNDERTRIEWSKEFLL
ncbi:MAG: 2'-5' RNA ligase family protein [Blastocatellia bacterium]